MCHLVLINNTIRVLSVEKENLWEFFWYLAKSHFLISPSLTHGLTFELSRVLQSLSSPLNFNVYLLASISPITAFAAASFPLYVYMFSMYYFLLEMQNFWIWWNLCGLQIGPVFYYTSQIPLRNVGMGWNLCKYVLTVPIWQVTGTNLKGLIR